MEKKAKTLNLHGYLLYSLYKMTVAIYKKIAKKLSIATLWKFTMSSQFLPLTSYSSPSTPSPFVYYSQSVILTMNSQMEQFPSIYKQASMQDQGGLGACTHIKFSEIRCSEIASEVILGQKQSCSSFMAHRVLFACPCMHLLSKLTLNSRERRY